MIQTGNMDTTHQPPSYDYATSSSPRSSHFPELNNGGYEYTSQAAKSSDTKSPDVRDRKALMAGPPSSPGPSSSYHPAPISGQTTTVYHYQNPRTGHTITSLLPPDHPEMICLQQGSHMTKSKFGIVGILAAVFWFPLGVGLCILDRKVSCRRCDMVLHHGILD